MTSDVRAELDYDAYMAMIACAIRFDGYRWAEETGRGHDWLWAALTRFRSHLTLSEDHEENLATFFALQRSIRNDEGSCLALPDDYIAFRLLFLALYRTPVPKRFVHPDYDREWRRQKGRRETIAAIARSEIIALAAARAGIMSGIEGASGCGDS